MSVFTIEDIRKAVGPQENLREKADSVREELKEVNEARKDMEKPFTAEGIATWIGVDRRSRADLMKDPQIVKTRNELANIAQNRDDKSLENAKKDVSRDTKESR